MGVRKLGHFLLNKLTEVIMTAVILTFSRDSASKALPFRIKAIK